ncbi:MAG: hypothetical protein LBK75_07860 [Oscillospiraceae bacterium]|jgi:ketosteroid isomerase-like protein|nr:hypothetical protein [Oscillospiraceae bacterium]
MAEVTAVYDAVASLPEIGKAFDNLIWIEMAGGPYGGIYKSAQEIVENVFLPLNADWDHFQLAPQEFIETENTIIMLGNYKGINRKTGKELDARVAHVWKCDGEKLIFEQFTDTALFRALRS